jgi:UDP-N-acetylmuramate dehydrogenase
MKDEDEPGVNVAIAKTDPLRGVLTLREPMSRHTSWRVGGVADRAYQPADLPDLERFLRSLPPDEPVLFIGLGSNLLIRDGGLRGTVILMHGALNQIALWHGDRQDQPVGVYAEAGVAAPRVARFGSRHGLQGAEFLAGIPGTMGGALAMNAGCYGSETWALVAEVLTIDRFGELRRRLPGNFEIGYRHVALRVRSEESGERRRETPPPSSPPTSHGEEWFVAAWLRLQPGDGEASRQKIKEMLGRRIASQPLELPNAGSVFRNPPGDYAARLIEASGLKGYRIGGAMVSPKHANFIVNMGGATAADIEALIGHVQQTVRDAQGVELVREVRIIGDR